MREADKKFIEEQFEDDSDDSLMKHYRASWFESANFKCPEHHTFRFAWDCCYLPMESLWPTAACQQCQKAKDLLKDAARQREDFLKKRLRCQNKAGPEAQNHLLTEKDCSCSEGCRHKNGEEESENMQDTDPSRLSLQISFCDGDNLAEVLSDRLVRMSGRMQARTFCGWVKHILLEAGLLFLRHSFEIVVRVRTNQCSYEHHTTQKQEAE